MNNYELELMATMRAIQVRPAPLSEVSEIISAVAEALQIPFEKFISTSRKREFTEARFICFQLLRLHTNLTLQEIGAIFNRDHSTIIYGLDIFNALLQSKDKSFLTCLNKVEEELPGMYFIAPSAINAYN